MKVFWLRLFSYSVLWVLSIVLESNSVPISIMLFAASLGLYFFLSLRKGSLLIYSIIGGILLLHSYLVANDSALTILLFLYLIIDALFQLTEKELYLALITQALFIILVMSIHQEWNVEILIMSIFLFFLVIVMNRMNEERKEQKETYEMLLGEYRKLKRMNLALEHNARMEERTKIARDIHDSVGHRLTALIMKLEVLIIQNKSNEYEDLKNMAKKSLEETRHAVQTLQTEENEGIATVVHLIRKLEAESHILVQFTMKQGVLSIPLSNEKNVTLFRVIQESLTNAMRHTGSREVQVTLGRSATGDLAFEIKNAVFEPKNFTLGFGLNNMKDRMEHVNGTIHVYQTEKEFIVSGTIPSEGD